MLPPIEAPTTTASREVEVLQQLAEVTAVARHPLPVHRGLGLAVGTTVEGDDAVPGGQQRVDR